MSYTITKTNGDTLVTVPDTELNTDYGITLVGRNYAGYGVYLNDNFVSLMENFSKGTAPADPLEGQLWWNSTDNELQVWQGSVWKKIGHVTASTGAPSSTGRNVGDQWWDTTNQQLKVWAGETVANSQAQYTTTSYEISVLSTSSARIGDIVTTGNVISANAVTITEILSSSNIRVSTPATIYAGEVVTFTRGANWNLVGPAYTRDQQITGIYPRTLVDTQGVTRVVGLIYQKGQIIGSISKDNEYIPRTADAIDRLPIIKPGITLLEDSAPQLVRSVAATAAGSSGTTVVQLSDVAGLEVGDYVITGNIPYSSNKTIQAVFTNNSSISINTTALFEVNDVIVFQRGTKQSNMFHGTVTNAQRLNGVTADRFATLEADQAFTANISVGGNLLVGVNKTSISQTDSNLTILNTQSLGNVFLRTRISGITDPVTVFQVSGVTGLAEVRGAPTTANGVATKSYVDNSQGVALAAITANLAAVVNGAPVDKRDFGNIATILDTYSSNFDTVNTVLGTKADLDSPVLVGVPVAPTASVGTDTTQIATTAFTTAAINLLRTATNANVDAANAAIDLRATITSPDFAGTPQVPHLSDSDRSRRIPTTFFVSNLVTSAINTLGGDVSTKAPLLNPEFTGIPTAPTQANLTYTLVSTLAASLNIPVSGGTSAIATTAFVANAIANMPSANLLPYATKVSPTFEGIPRGTNAPEGTANTWIATTQFVAERSPVLSVNGLTGTVALTPADIPGAAPLASPALTGVPTTVDPPPGESSEWIPTTRWVSNIAANLAPQQNPTFIGTVTVPTPADNSNTTTAASTQWVKARIATGDVPRWGGATKWVETRSPISGEGANGDIWFKIIL